MHVGGARSALFDWLVARGSGGQFILRIEDTDQAREVPGAMGHIQKTLRWLGLEWDEGPGIGGPEKTYIQSERLPIYKEWAQMLADKGRAYADPYTPEEVEHFREAAKQAKKPFLFRDHRPADPPAWNGSQPLRLKSEPKAYAWHDEVLGDLSAGQEAVDDFILIKSDGFPTYNFCHIIDDYLMKVTHVIRGQEFVASMPRFLSLYDALEFPWPTFAHLPWIMAPDGRKKLSKRDGAKDILAYADEGYLPEAMLNFLASLGWNDGTEQEVFTVPELIEKFSLERVQRAGARFDERRLLWMNGAHIRMQPIDDLFTKVSNFWPPEAAQATDEYKKRVLALTQERLKYFAELSQLTRFFFTDLPVDMNLIDTNKQLSRLPRPELRKLLETAREELAENNFTPDDLTKRLNSLLEITASKPAILFSLIRIASTQAPASPGLSDTLAVLGKETSLRRIDATLQALA
jgi:glutamyl-tRNA synthetase